MVENIPSAEQIRQEAQRRKVPGRVAIDDPQQFIEEKKKEGFREENGRLVKGEFSKRGFSKGVIIDLTKEGRVIGIKESRPGEGGGTVDIKEFDTATGRIKKFRRVLRDIPDRAGKSLGSRTETFGPGGGRVEKKFERTPAEKRLRRQQERREMPKDISTPSGQKAFLSGVDKERTEQLNREFASGVTRLKVGEGRDVQKATKEFIQERELRRSIGERQKTRVTTADIFEESGEINLDRPSRALTFLSMKAPESQLETLSRQSKGLRQSEVIGRGERQRQTLRTAFKPDGNKPGIFERVGTGLSSIPVIGDRIGLNIKGSKAIGGFIEKSVVKANIFAQKGFEKGLINRPQLLIGKFQLGAVKFIGSELQNPVRSVATTGALFGVGKTAGLIARGTGRALAKTSIVKRTPGVIKKTSKALGIGVFGVAPVVGVGFEAVKRETAEERAELLGRRSAQFLVEGLAISRGFTRGRGTLKVNEKTAKTILQIEQPRTKITKTKQPDVISITEEGSILRTNRPGRVSIIEESVEPGTITFLEKGKILQEQFSLSSIRTAERGGVADLQGQIIIKGKTFRGEIRTLQADPDAPTLLRSRFAVQNKGKISVFEEAGSTTEPIFKEVESAFFVKTRKGTFKEPVGTLSRNVFVESVGEPKTFKGDKLPDFLFQEGDVPGFKLVDPFKADRTVFTKTAIESSFKRDPSFLGTVELGEFGGVISAKGSVPFDELVFTRGFSLTGKGGKVKPVTPKTASDDSFIPGRFARTKKARPQKETFDFPKFSDDSSQLSVSALRQQGGLSGSFAGLTLPETTTTTIPKTIIPFAITPPKTETQAKTGIGLLSAPRTLLRFQPIQISRPATRQETRQSIRQISRPVLRQISRPAVKQISRPAVKQITRQSTRQAIRPISRQAVRQKLRPAPSIAPFLPPPIIPTRPNIDLPRRKRQRSTVKKKREEELFGTFKPSLIGIELFRQRGITGKVVPKRVSGVGIRKVVLIDEK